METMVYKEVSPAAKIRRKLDECKNHLQLNNLFSCIVSFREVLEFFINATNMSEADKNKVVAPLNDFQQTLSNSHQFRDLYGSVAFRDNDFRTSYEFIGQLIKIKEDEIASVLINKEVGEILNLGNLNEEEQQKTLMMVSLVERGEQSVLQKLVSENDDLASLVLTYYNDNGINSRATGDINKAIQEYKKALFVSPHDEHLFYNLARACMETGDKKSAEENIRRALSINPDFTEGTKLLNYITQWSL
ncbi:MAG: Tetratricopeptide repeat protein [Smithella sp. PtaU1.Bin162]|nr:MAG: Tetratricopeptide repeat protein [Smithella sp. PtaU1.Bin162]